MNRAQAFASRGLEAVRRHRAEAAHHDGHGDGHGDATDALRAWVASELERLQVDTYVQDFPRPRSRRRGGRVGFGGSGGDSVTAADDANDNATAAATGRNIHSVARAPRGSGREGIVIATPIGDATRGATSRADAEVLGLGLALFARLAAAPWLAKVGTRFNLLSTTHSFRKATWFQSFD